MKTKFPKDFLWGSATCAYQIEGDNNNDWTDWEKKSLTKRLKKAKQKKWPEFILEKYPNPLEKENFLCKKACNSYKLYKQDIKLLKSLRQNAYRFSIEWSRIEPKKGKYNKKEIEHYRKIIKELKKQRIEPFVTLWHFTLPKWVRDQGGWESEETIKNFSNYVEKISSEYKNLGINFWITLNEPNVYSGVSYVLGIFPPQKTNPLKAIKVLNNLANAHKNAYKIIKRYNKNTNIGVAQNIVVLETEKITNIKEKVIDFLFNLNFLNKISKHQDFIGLNHYFPYHFKKKDSEKLSDVGWEISPKSIYKAIKEVSKYNKPIYITENGIADARDILRGKFLTENLKWVAKAIKKGINVKGYFHWSLLDNFEWDKGYWPRFGLVEVDYKTFKRKIKPSALVYKKIIEQNSI